MSYHPSQNFVKRASEVELTSKVTKLHKQLLSLSYKLGKQPYFRFGTGSNFERMKDSIIKLDDPCDLMLPLGYFSSDQIMQIEAYLKLSFHFQWANSVLKEPIRYDHSCLYVGLSIDCGKNWNGKIVPLSVLNEFFNKNPDAISDIISIYKNAKVGDDKILIRFLKKDDDVDKQKLFDLFKDIHNNIRPILY